MNSRTPTGRASHAKIMAVKIASAAEGDSGSDKNNLDIISSSSKISRRLQPSIANTLGKSKHLTPFSAAYSRGGIPCRLSHGSVKHKIVWTTAPQTLSYNPLLVTFIDGLRESQHPYIFLARQGLVDLLEAPGAQAKVLPLIPNLLQPMRSALMSKTKSVFDSALSCLVRLATLCGPHGGLTSSHLGLLIPPVGARVLDPDLRDDIFEALRLIIQSCGYEAEKLIKLKVPTYSSWILN